jgi:hypothetical protein
VSAGDGRVPWVVGKKVERDQLQAQHHVLHQEEESGSVQRWAGGEWMGSDEI